VAQAAGRESPKRRLAANDAATTHFMASASGRQFGREQGQA